MVVGLHSVCDNWYEPCTNIAALPVAQRNLALFLHPEEIRPGHRMRVHGPLSHFQGPQLAERKNEHGDLLPEAQAQQFTEITAVRVFGAGYPPLGYT